MRAAFCAQESGVAFTLRISITCTLLMCICLVHISLAFTEISVKAPRLRGECLFYSPLLEDQLLWTLFSKQLMNFQRKKEEKNVKIRKFFRVRASGLYKNIVGFCHYLIVYIRNDTTRMYHKRVFISKKYSAFFNSFVCKFK